MQGNVHGLPPVRCPQLIHAAYFNAEDAKGEMVLFEKSEVFPQVGLGEGMVGNSRYRVQAAMRSETIFVEVWFCTRAFLVKALRDGHNRPVLIAYGMHLQTHRNRVASLVVNVTLYFRGFPFVDGLAQRAGSATVHATCPIALAQNIGLDGMPDGIVAMESRDFFSAVIPEENFALPVE